MSKKWNNEFLQAYIRLEELCNEKFGLIKGGVSEYIRRLNDLRFAEGGPETLRTLDYYRSVRNSMVHESDAVRRLNVTKKDVDAIRRFTNDIKHKRDPLSRYLTRARRYRYRRRFLRGVLILVAAHVVAAVVACLVCFL